MTMEEEESVAAAPAFQMNRVFPDVPAPPRDTPSPPRHAHFRKDDPEESLLGSFIQWVQTNKEASSKKKKKTVQSSDAHIDQVERPDSEPRTETLEKTPTFANKRKREERRNKRSKETTGHHDNGHQRFTSNPAFKDVHLSRPATPQPAAPAVVAVYDATRDKYRIIYLTVLLEEQLDHVRHVIETMITHKAEKFRISSMIKVKHALSQFKSQLLGLHAQNEATMKMFGSRADLEEFFGSVETICGSVQEISMDGCEQDTDMAHVMKMGILGNNKDLKDGKTRIRKSKKSPPTANDVTCLFKKEEQNGGNHDKHISGPNTDSGMDSTKLLSRKKINNHDGRRRKSRKSADGERDAESPQESDNENVRISSSMNMETVRRKTSDNKPRSDRNAEDDNDVVTHKRRVCNVKSECGRITTPHDVTNKDGDVMSTASQKAARSASEVKRLLYRNAKLEQSKGKYPCKTVESEPDEGADPLADNGADWPLIHAKQLGVKHREQEINSLMEDIDVLMSKTELRNGQVIISGMTFEELMMGPGQQRGRPQVIQKSGTSKTRPQTEPGSDGGKKPGASKTRPQTKPGEVTSGHKVVVKNKNGKKNSNTRDEFIDELDKLLNECDNI